MTQSSHAPSQAKGFRIGRLQGHQSFDREWHQCLKKQQPVLRELFLNHCLPDICAEILMTLDNEPLFVEEDAASLEFVESWGTIHSAVKDARIGTDVDGQTYLRTSPVSKSSDVAVEYWRMVTEADLESCETFGDLMDFVQVFHHSSRGDWGRPESFLDYVEECVGERGAEFSLLERSLTRWLHDQVPAHLLDELQRLHRAFLEVEDEPVSLVSALFQEIDDGWFLGVMESERCECVEAIRRLDIDWAREHYELDYRRLHLRLESEQEMKQQRDERREELRAQRRHQGVGARKMFLKLFEEKFGYRPLTARGMIPRLAKNQRDWPKYRDVLKSLPADDVMALLTVSDVSNSVRTEFSHGYTLF